MKNEKDIFSRGLAIVSIIFSVFALYQTYHHDKISIKPMLSFIVLPDDSKPEAGLYLENSGLGPAIIQSMVIFVDRTPIKSWEQVIDYCHIKHSEEIDWTELGKNDPVRVGESIPMFYRKTKNKVGLDSFLECVDKHLAFSVTYCSFDDECRTECSDEGRC